jgi:hypothetical protein
MSNLNLIKNKLLRPIDMYGDIINFKIDGSNKTKSLFGGTLSLTTYIIYIAIVYYNIQQFLKKDPQVTLYTQVRGIEVQESIPLNDFKFLVNIIEYNDNGTLQLLKYKPSGNLFSLDDNINGSNDNLGNFTICNESLSYYDEYKNKFKKYGPDKFICNDAFENTTKNVNLGGTLFSDSNNTILSGYLKLNVSSYSEHKMVLFSIINKVPDIRTDEGYSKYNHSIFDYYNGNNIFSVRIKVIKNTMNTDNNLIFNFIESNISIFYTYDIGVYTSYSRQNNDTLNVSIQFEMSNLEYIYQRSYLKFDALLANIFAMTSIVSMIFVIIHYVFNYGTMEYTLIKNLYMFKDGIDELTSMRKPINFKNNDASKHKVWLGISKENTIRKSNFLFFSCKHNINYTKFNIGNSLLEYDMNIIVVMRKLIEYENLKKIILEDYQNNALMSLNSRLIDYTLSADENLKRINKGCQIDAIEFPNENKTSIDNRLIDLFNNRS